METNDIAKLDQIRQQAVDHYIKAKETGDYEDIEAGITLHYKDGVIREFALASDTLTDGLLLYVQEHSARGIVVIRLNETASKYIELKPFNLQ